VRITNPPKKKKHRGLIIFASILLVIAALLMDSRYRIVSPEFALSYNNLPQSFDGYRVVQLSDLHMTDFGTNDENLINAVKKQKPDIIVITGDMLNDHSQIANESQTEKISPFLEELAQLAPCYFVSGNHEWASGEIAKLTELLAILNIVYLHNDYVLLKKGSDSIVLAGVEDPNGPKDMTKPDALIDKISKKYPGKYVMLLAHRNDWLKKYPNLEVNTILCGHSHGGIVRLPFLGGVFGTEHDFFPKYDAGVFNERNYDLFVSRGLGGDTIIPRFLNNPELVTVVLKKS